MKRKSFPEAMHEIENNPDIKTREQLIAEGVVTAELMGTKSATRRITLRATSANTSRTTAVPWAVPSTSTRTYLRVCFAAQYTRAHL